MAMVPLWAVAWALVTLPRPDAEVGASAELRGGLVPTSATGPLDPELRLTVRPYAAASLRTRRWETRLQYALRPNWRIVGVAAGWKPLWYHEGEASGLYRWTRRVSQRLSLNAAGGELDYFGLLGVYDDGEQALPQLDVMRQVTFGAVAGLDVVTAPRNLLSIDAAAQYDGNAPPSAWHDDLGDVPIPLRYTLDFSVTDRVIVSPTSSLSFTAAGGYTALSTGPRFVGFDVMVAADRRWTRRLTTSLGAGVYYARRTACLNPDTDANPLAPGLRLLLTHRSLTRRRFALSLSLEGSYTSTVDFLRAAVVRMVSLGAGVDVTDRHDWTGSVRLYASSRQLPDTVSAESDPLLAGELAVVGGSASLTYTPRDAWRFVLGSRLDFRGDVLTDDPSLSRAAMWLFLQAQARLWTTRPERRRN